MYPDIIWKTSQKTINYQEALDFMENHVAQMLEQKADNTIWLLEHDPLYTAGSSARDDELLDAQFPVHKIGRGGKYTYHGPGQRVIYTMLDLRGFYEKIDVRNFVWRLEEWIILTLAEFGIEAFREPGRIGIWTGNKTNLKKIAAIGIRLRKTITFHGIAVNINPNLSHYNGIVPCGISDAGVTSMKELGVSITSADFDKALKRVFGKVFEGV